MYSISYYNLLLLNHSEAKWDGSFELESGLKRSMYRTPSFDPTGSKVGLGRAKYTGKGMLFVWPVVC